MGAPNLATLWDAEHFGEEAVNAEVAARTRAALEARASVQAFGMWLHHQVEKNRANVGRTSGVQREAMELRFRELEQAVELTRRAWLQARTLTGSREFFGARMGELIQLAAELEAAGDFISAQATRTRLVLLHEVMGELEDRISKEGRP